MPRKTVRELHDPLQILRASMRPRPDAAENQSWRSATA